MGLLGSDLPNYFMYLPASNKTLDSTTQTKYKNASQQIMGIIYNFNKSLIKTVLIPLLVKPPSSEY